MADRRFSRPGASAMMFVVPVLLFVLFGLFGSRVA